MSYQAVKIGHRFAGMFIDYLIIFFGLGILAAMMLFAWDLNSLGLDSDINRAEVIAKWAMITLLTIWVSKDVFGGRSIAKRALKQQLLNYKTEAVADPFLTLLRNLFSLIWPLEFVWALVNPERRLGDLVAGTKLVNYQGSQPAPNPELWRSLGAIALSGLFWYLLISPLYPEYGAGRGSEVAPVVESVDEAKSKVLQEALVFKLGEAFPEIEATVFEQSDSDGEGFIQVKLFREAEKTIGLSRLYNFRAMIIEISDQTLPETVGWSGELLVSQKSPIGSSQQTLYW